MEEESDRQDEINEVRQKTCVNKMVKRMGFLFSRIVVFRVETKMFFLSQNKARISELILID